MYAIILLIFALLCIGLLLTLYQNGKFAFWSKICRIVILSGSIAYFSYWFVERSVSQFLENSLAVQVINNLPQPIDFYLVRIDNRDDVSLKYNSKHIGTIRPDYYRIEYLNMQKSNEFWIAGYIGKNKLVYFSQNSVPDKNQDQVIEVRNYINQSQKLSAIASERIDTLKYDNVKISIWVCLDLLLIFLNFVMIFRKNKE